MEPNVKCMLPGVEKLPRLLLISPISSFKAEQSFSALRKLKTWLRSTMTQVHLNHVVVCYVHWDIFSELSCKKIAKEFVMSNDASCRVFGRNETEKQFDDQLNKKNELFCFMHPKS